MPKDHIFLSDVHIQKIDEENHLSLISFLDSIKKTTHSLYILGDLFDFWYGYRSVVFYEYIPILNKFLELKNAGINLYFLEGNHEFRFDLFFGNVLKANVNPRYLNIDINNKKFFLAHGDSIDTIDLGHKVLNFFIKNPLVYMVVGLSHPGFWWKIAGIVSKFSRNRLDNGNQKLIEAYERFAEKKFSEGSDVIILGHSHDPKIQNKNINGREKVLVYLGDWLTERSYVKYDGTSFELCNFNKL